MIWYKIGLTIAVFIIYATVAKAVFNKRYSNKDEIVSNVLAFIFAPFTLIMMLVMKDVEE
jgi:uncharacterized membrane protein YhaH (DUF805 family)